ncbi:ABC transporter permease [Actinomadura madurae]|uniref:ABC transporter permease n=1 Tax=Actinomadura madurae TaxID=1993 RepID=UPI0020262558|nr:ABC transporter permease [Actinomadura madurae]MCP9948866.1 ABC transporter permease [Actinomadura madurae]MCP9965643.1 ABC transporter permease [Actinomadura madurae]URM94476.1 ABC transporter permease [Actinomadura madurae]URN05188.1 ABC transporter permease [Actinomadura madurae]
MTQAVAGPPVAGPDERLARRSPLRRLLGRPELGALLGAVALFVFFSVVADAFLQTGSFSTVLYASSTFGIMAVGVSLLMIGGEFDLSAGVMVTSSALIAALTAYQLTLNVWAGVVISLVLTLALGMVNGVLYVRTKLPSFIITLATFFMLAGLNLGVTKALTGNVASDSVRDMDGFDSARAVFASDIDILGVNVKITVFWWLLFVAIATWILLRTRTGNWIFAAGGAAGSARAVGVPVARVKIGLFMAVAFCAWFSGMHLVFAFAAVQSGEGVGNEFLYIICAVIGGCLLTGGYGSAIGAAIGAFIFGMTNKGIVYAEWNPDWFRFFLGAMLLIATVVNLIVRRRVERSS